jgi:hypothetical protein
MSALLCSPLPIEARITVPKRAGIEWDELPCSLDFDALLPSWAQPLCQPLVYTAPPPRSWVVTNTPSSTFEFDPLLRLRMLDSVLCNRCPVNEFRLPLAPVAGKDSRIATLKNDVVRLWDSEGGSLVKSVHLPKGYGGPVSAFDVDWESKVGALGRMVYEKSFETQQPVVQAVSLDKSSLARTMFTGQFVSHSNILHHLLLFLAC